MTESPSQLRSSGLPLDLPDRPALEQLSRALWSRGTLRGAAILVGAGVSRAGARLLSDDAPLPPLWSDLSDDMARELYSAQSTAAPRDPLRLAEEFRVGLGDASLADFLRRRIRDDTFEPGVIHHELLNLPWADVLTTNYDTLLERAVHGARRSYDLVLTESDLPHARGPRIIKLHGSLRDGAGVVISEEDYRTYPWHRAAFVNTARQVFIENELCLLGFSGDDPNFLQWAGWVRDRLGGSARRIYLVGVLELSPIKRRLLEARGIAPIDLALAVKNERADQRHAAAISSFLAHLKAARPSEADDWEPASYSSYPRQYSNDHAAWSRNLKNPEKVAEALRASALIWQSDRQTCPAWLVCPSGVRLSIKHGSNVDSLPLALDALSENERRDVLLELAWRYDRAALALPLWLAERMDSISTPEALAEADPEVVRALARIMLGAARLSDDEEMFTRRAERFESLVTPYELPALVTHERCLFARDRLDFTFVAENVNRIKGDDPIWGVRRAALLYWVGEAEKALQAIGAAARDLRTRILRDPDSIALRSRLAWLKTLADALRWDDKGALLTELGSLDLLTLRNYDPWEELRTLDAEVGNKLRERLEDREIEPGFEAGSYRDNGKRASSGSTVELTPLSELSYVAERAGWPHRMQNVNMLGTRFEKALRLAFQPTATWYSAFLATRPNYSKGAIDIHLGRLAVARLDADEVAKLRKRLEHAITFWRARIYKASSNFDDLESLRLYVEALSRVTARDDAEIAKAHVRLAVELGRDERLSHWWMNEPISHLLKRAFDAVPLAERAELSSDLLRFPLDEEKDSGGPLGGQEPGTYAYCFVRRSGNEAVFDARVADFLQYLDRGERSRPEAAIRLLSLHEKGQLTEKQVASFADALWREARQHEDALPKGTNLLLFAFLIAPAPPDVDACARVRAKLFGPGNEPNPDDLVGSVSSRKFHIKPSETEAVRLFDYITSERAKTPDANSLRDAFLASPREQRDRMMACVLGLVAAPALAQDDRTVERAEAVLSFIAKEKSPEALSALPVFYGLNPDIDLQIERAFRRPLAIGDRCATPAAVQAINQWLRLSEADQTLRLPNTLRDRVLQALERGRIGGLASLIYLTRRLIEAGLCGAPELERITEVLDELSEATDYGPPDGDADIESDRAVSLPLIRAECVLLAQALEEKGVTIEAVYAWRELAARDPLPEVRNAKRRMVDE